MKCKFGRTATKKPLGEVGGTSLSDGEGDAKRQTDYCQRKKGNKSFINMMNLLDAARHQQNTHLVLVMLGLLTTYSKAADTKRLPLQSDNSNGNGALNYRISKDDSLTVILAIILCYSTVKRTYLVSYKFARLTRYCWYLLMSH